MATLPTVLDEKINQSSQLIFNQNFLTVNFGDNFEQRAAIGIDPFRERWALSIGPVDQTKLNTFISFWNNHGFVDSWEWQSPEDTVVKNWVFNSEPTITNNAEFYIIDVEVRQVRE